MSDYCGIAVAGKAGSGKSRLARALCAELDGAGVVLALADPIKAEVRRRYGLVKTDPGGREKLIEVGESRRLQDPLYWVKRAVEQIQFQLEMCRVPIVDDVRFPQELAALVALGFYSVRIDAASTVRYARLVDRGDDPTHAFSRSVTETALDEDEYDLRFNTDDCPINLAAPAIISRAGLGQQKGGHLAAA